MDLEANRRRLEELEVDGAARRARLRGVLKPGKRGNPIVVVLEPAEYKPWSREGHDTTDEAA